MDMFNEKIVKRRKNALDYTYTAALALAAILLSFLSILYIPQFSLIIIVGAFYLAYFFSSKRNIEYEYAVTNGDLDIDMIVNQKKRKRVFSQNAKDFDAVARIKSVQYTKEIKECKSIKDYTSHSENAEVWFIYMRLNGAPTVILFEPTDKMIENFYLFNPRKIFKNL
jgi:hypothetical protein